MRIRSDYRRPRSVTLSQIMTPMIDVVFLLLIFFVCSVSDAEPEQSLSTDLSAGTTETPKLEEQPMTFTEIWLTLGYDHANKTGLVDMNGTEYRDLEVLGGQLRLLAELGPENPVILDVADDVPIQHVISVLDACEAANFNSIHFAAE